MDKNQTIQSAYDETLTKGENQFDIPPETGINESDVIHWFNVHNIPYKTVEFFYAGVHVEF